MIKYIGSKRVLVPRIVELAARLPEVATAVDVFTGTTRVAQGLKRAGMHVVANDLATYSQVLARCYVEADADEVDVSLIARKLERLQQLPDVDGYVTETFCRQARYFQPHNGRRIDAIRPAIDELADDALEHAILLTSLLEAADRVDSTTGVQMAYLKSWAARSERRLELRVPQLVPGGGAMLGLDANELARTRGGFDLAYVDPPYNQHSYHANYHVWETIVRNDAPPTYGVARKREDCRTTKSDYNSKRRAWAAFADLVRTIDARFLLVSFSDDGHFAGERINELLAERGEVAALPLDHKRYVGAQIGIHDPRGVRVGTVGALRTREWLYLVGEGARELLAAGYSDPVVAQ